MRAVTARGRWAWGASGLVMIVALCYPGVRLITMSGNSQGGGPPPGTVTRTVTVTQPVTSLTVESYGAPVQVTAARVSHTRVSETLGYAPPASGQPGVAGSLPAVLESVRDGQLSVGGPACSGSEACISFTVIVPPDVTVTVASDGAAVSVSGTAGADLDSGGSSINVTGVRGPVNLASDGGPLVMSDVNGPVQADTGGGSLTAQDITARAATVTTDGGPLQLTGSRIGTLHAVTGGGGASIALAAAPQEVTLDCDGGPATLTVPRGQYAVTADSDGGPEQLGITSDPAARRSITVTTGGGSLQIGLVSPASVP
jgi:hypothetical protein